MKQGSFRAVRLTLCLILMAGLAGFSAFADEHSVDSKSVIIETFVGDTSHEWTVGSKTFTYDYSWQIDASRFATSTDYDQFPKMVYVPSWPQALFGFNRSGKELNSLGIQAKFDRRGYNWIDVFPVDGNDDPFEIPLPGRVSSMDIWVWGSNMNLYMEAYVRDLNGVVHCINMGNLHFAGWRNVQVRIPSNIIQSKRILPRLAGLNFVKFRIWTTPNERVDNFFVYLNQFKIMTDVFESLFDGSELADPDVIQEIWSN